MSGISIVYEVHGGKTAARNGWDFTVCRDWNELVETIDNDTDELSEGDELRIVFRRYTQQQMDEVYFDGTR